MPPPAARILSGWIRRRIQREPVAYIVGRKGFRHIDLAVDSRVLIPRPDTELLVEVALGPSRGARACTTWARARARWPWRCWTSVPTCA